MLQGFPMRGGLSIGVIIALVLIVYWWMKDHPSTQPVHQGALHIWVADI